MKAFFQKFAFTIAAILGVGGFGAIAFSGTAGAATIESTFSTTQASLITELGYGVALVVALLLIGLGVRMLIKWSKKGVSAG